MNADACADDCSQDDTVEVETMAPSVSGESTTESSEDSDKTPDSCVAMMASQSESSDSEALVTPVADSSSVLEEDRFSAKRMSWSEVQRRRRAISKDEEPSADITRMTRSLLNKLTEERFESLCGQILALPLSTPDQLATLATEIFEKAATQNGFRSLYTELCARLDAHLADAPSAIGGKAFRKALVSECQASFERHAQSTHAVALEKLYEENLEVAIKLKTHRIGNMRFIGELFVRRLLAPKLIAPIVHELLDGDELAIESLIALLVIIAPIFEAKPSLYQAPLKDAFANLRRKQTQKGISSRLRCGLSDLFDARARGWAHRSP
jgi:translation initiation factor 4G